MLIAIAAVADNGIIGKDNHLPWPHIKADMKRFKKATIRHTVVMGRKTCLSLSGPLSNRTNIVLTRDKEFDRPGFLTLNHPHKVLELGENADIYIIGGQQIYSHFMPYVDMLLITHIHETPEGDTFFPEIEKSQWDEYYAFGDADPNDDSHLEYNFITYRRKVTAFDQDRAL